MEKWLKKLSAVALTAAVTLLVSCSSNKAMTAGHVKENRQVQRTHTVREEQPTFNYDAEATALLVKEARTWLGVPYLYGGNDRNGIDCSGFVLQVYSRALDIKLPRTSASQSQWCANVNRESLIPGDLVFFDTKKERDGRVSHVGLYIGDGQMIHASSSKGVIISSIEGNYYSSRLLTGGKVQQYHAMISKSDKVKNPNHTELLAQNTPTAKSESAPRKVKEQQPKPKQGDKAATASTTPKPEQKARQKAQKTVQPAKAPGTKTKPATPKPTTTLMPQPEVAQQTTTAVDARTAVLQKLKEQDPEKFLTTQH